MFEVFIMLDICITFLWSVLTLAVRTVTDFECFSCIVLTDEINVSA